MDMASLNLLRSIVMPALGATLYMLCIASILSIVLGFILAIILVVTKEDGLAPNLVVQRVLDFILNVIRSFPFMILVVAIIPLTRLLVGTSIGMQAAIVPLTLAGTANAARLIEGNLSEVDKSLIQAAQSFGASSFQIIFKVMLEEAIPAIVINSTILLISILSMTAMAGTVGAGGLGSVAMIYGYQGFNETIMYGTVIILIIIVQIIQTLGMKLYKKLK